MSKSCNSTDCKWWIIRTVWLWEVWFSLYRWFHTFIWPAVWAVSGAPWKLNCFLEWIIKTPLWLIIHGNYTPCLWHWRSVSWFSPEKPQNWFTESMHVHEGVQLIIRKQKYVENKPTFLHTTTKHEQFHWQRYSYQDWSALFLTKIPIQSH